MSSIWFYLRPSEAEPASRNDSAIRAAKVPVNIQGLKNIPYMMCFLILQHPYVGVNQPVKHIQTGLSLVDTAIPFQERSQLSSYRHRKYESFPISFTRIASRAIKYLTRHLRFGPDQIRIAKIKQRQITLSACVMMADAVSQVHGIDLPLVVMTVRPGEGSK